MKRFICIIFLFFAFVGGLILIRLINPPSTLIQDMKHFYFHYSMDTSYLGDVSYEVNCDYQCMAQYKPYGVRDEDISFQKVDQEFMDQLLDILNRYQVKSWDGFQESDIYVLDGNSFSFSLITEDGKSISASGYMKFPKNYSDVKNELEILFQSLNEVTYE